MSKFTDADGRDWVLIVSTVEIDRIREELEVDLLDVGNEKLFTRLCNDDELIVDILHACLREEIEKREIDPVSFARALRGDALDDASQAFLKAWVDFFRKHRRAVLETALAKTEVYLQRTADHAIEVLNSEKMDHLMMHRMQQVNQQIDEQLQQSCDASLSNGAVLPELPPAPG